MFLKKNSYTTTRNLPSSTFQDDTEIQETVFKKKKKKKGTLINVHKEKFHPHKTYLSGWFWSPGSLQKRKKRTLTNVLESKASPLISLYSTLCLPSICINNLR